MNLFAPKKFKSFKIFKNLNFKIIKKDKYNFLRFGFYGIQSQGFGTITGRQLESGRRFLTRRLLRKSKVWRRVTITQPLTQKPKLARMGKGKGKFKTWIGYVKPGTILYEMGYISPIFLKKKISFFGVKNKFHVQIDVIKKKYKLTFNDKFNFIFQKIK